MVSRRRRFSRHLSPSAGAEATDRSLSGLSAVVMVLLVVYASLYPFEGWRWPAGMQWSEALRLPWARWRDRPDEALNVLGYVPLGMVLTVALLRRSAPWWAAALVGVLMPAMLSYALEVTQWLLPRRVASVNDWIANSIGACLGAAIAFILQVTGWLHRAGQLRDRWFNHDSAVALILLLLWPAALLAPAPLPFSLGQGWSELLSWVSSVLARLPLTAWGLAPDLAAAPSLRTPLAPLTEVAVILMGVLSPMILAGAASPAGWRRVGLMMMVAAWGWAGMSLSTAMNFGPRHALAWLTPSTSLALLLCLPLALLLTWPGRRLCAALGLVVLAASLALGAQIPPDAFQDLTQATWEQGRFIRFHGLSLWVAWLWPFAAIGWLLVRLGGGGDHAGA